MSNITTSETQRLKQLEKIISAGKKTFVEVGLALEEIRDKKLYRHEHGTFEKYCQRVWGWSANYGCKQITAANVAKELGTVVPNEAVAREVAKIPLPQRRKIVSEASTSNSGKLTAKAVKNAVATLPKRGEKPKKQMDSTGIEIPPELVLFWNRNEEVSNLLSSISEVKNTLEKAQEDKDRLFRMVDIQGTVSRLKMCYEEIASARSYAVCPECNGLSFKDCAQCKGRGTLSKFHWGMISEQVKELRK